MKKASLFLAPVLLAGLLIGTTLSTSGGASLPATANPILPASADPAPPSAEISNGLIHARLYLPDAEKGYYRGSRFDWSGVMPMLEYQGHSYCGQWFDKYSPTIHDAIMGPVEAFSPLGYEDAAPGGGFVKIGIGVLARKDASPYSPFKYYNLLDPGLWKVNKTKNKVAFIHRLDHTPYPYVYTKTILLPKGRAELVLTHSLKNTGRRVIETDVYDHNLFFLDRQPIGPGSVLRFSFPLSAEEARGLGDLAAMRGDSIVMLRQPAAGESVYAILHGYGEQAAGYDIRLEDRATGAAMRILCDRPLSKLAYWGSTNILCPEPYLRVTARPGETVTWKITYQFYTTHEK